MRHRTAMLNQLLSLCFLYFSIAFLFALIYMALDSLRIGPVVDHYAITSHQESPADLFTRSLYFSFITLFSVGYGDITPFGLSKGVAIMEAMIGYILPAGFVINYLLSPKRHRI